MSKAKWELLYHEEGGPSHRGANYSTVEVKVERWSCSAHLSEQLVVLRTFISLASWSEGAENVNTVEVLKSYIQPCEAQRLGIQAFDDCLRVAQSAYETWKKNREGQ